jgi:uncharacterized protein (DUF362 family)
MVEGNAPINGSSVKMNLAIAGVDSISVDAIGASIIGFDPMEVGYITLARHESFGTADISQIEIRGEPLESVRRRLEPHERSLLMKY